MLFPSPLEFLAAFALAFVAGVLMAVAFAVYGKWMKNQGRITGQALPS
ncbi:MAG: hypothetical protein FWD62_12590 [Betaproteobacteria bacterium]|nr:hypothetical protein [Betaproteobacteria bacterium]